MIFEFWMSQAPFVSTENVFRKTFSAFADVCFDVKWKSNWKPLFFTVKSQRKKRKTVYGKNFCKPFSKTKTRESLDPFHFTPLCSLSFSLSALFSLLSSHSPNLSHPSHPQPPRVSHSTPSATQCLTCHPSHPNPSHPQPFLVSLSHSPIADLHSAHRSAANLLVPESPQPEPPSTPLGLSLALADRRSPRCPPICSFSISDPLVFSSRRSARSQPICLDLHLLVFFFSFCSISFFFFNS